MRRSRAAEPARHVLPERQHHDRRTPVRPRTWSASASNAEGAAVRRAFMNRIRAALETSRLRNLMTSRRLTFPLLAVVAGALLLAPVAGADLLTPESGGSKNADDIDTLY